MLAHNHTERWLTQPNRVRLLILNDGPICQITPSLSDDIYQSLHCYILSRHTLWITIWASSCSTSVFPPHRKFREERDFFHRVFPELSSVAPTRCSAAFYWAREYHCSQEEQWSTLLPVVQVNDKHWLSDEWKATGTNTASLSAFSVSPRPQIPLFLSLSNEIRARHFTSCNQILSWKTLKFPKIQGNDKNHIFSFVWPIY